MFLLSGSYLRIVEFEQWVELIRWYSLVWYSLVWCGRGTELVGTFVTCDVSSDTDLQ